MEGKPMSDEHRGSPLEEEHLAHKHLDWETLERALRGEIAAAEVIRDLLQHLLAVCSECRRVWRAVALPGRPGRAPGEGSDAAPESGDEDDYETAFERAMARVRAREPDLEEERRRAPERVRALLAAPEGEQRALLRRDPGLATWGVCDLLINQAYQATFQDPAAGRELAGLALRVAEVLDPGRYGRRFLADVRALAWAYLGNARRVASDLRGAEEALAAAERLLGEGVGEPLVRAQVLNLQASLRRGQRRFRQSRRLLGQVAAIYREVGDRHMEGRTLVKQAHSAREAGEPEEAVALLGRAVELVEAERDPRLDLCARHNLVDCLIDLERLPQAETLLAEIQPLYHRFTDSATYLRRRWVEGRLAAALERFEVAEQAFRDVRQGFIQREIGYDAALASLDLAVLYLRQGRTAPVQALAEEMLPIFRSRDVHREAMAALLVFQQAARAETLTVKRVERIAAYLRRARHDPGYRFEEPS